MKTHKIIPVLKYYNRKDTIFKINEIKCAYKGTVFLWLYEIVTKSHRDVAPWPQSRQFFLNSSDSFRRPIASFTKCMPICDGTSLRKLPNPANSCFKINFCTLYHFTGNNIYHYGYYMNITLHAISSQFLLNWFHFLGSYISLGYLLHNGQHLLYQNDKYFWRTGFVFIHSFFTPVTSIYTYGCQVYT